LALSTAERDSLLDMKGTFLLDVIIRFDDIGAGFGSERPEVINSAACDAAMESKQYYAGEGMVQLAASVTSLVKYGAFCRFKRDCWIKRNGAMLDNILNWVKIVPARTVLVLCGYQHRYHLRNALTKRAGQDAIILKKYRSY
jgi:hypothetical protein